MVQILVILVAAIFINNIVLSQFLGICSFLGVSKKTETAFGMGLAVTFVMALASFISFIVYKFILAPAKVEYLYTVAFILVVAALVQFVEMVMQKLSEPLYKALGIFLPLITTNCAILGIVIINMNNSYTLLESMANGVGAALGYFLAIMLLSGIRERIDNNKGVPAALQGFPLTLITAGLMSIAFLGFQGLLQ